MDIPPFEMSDIYQKVSPVSVKSGLNFITKEKNKIEEIKISLSLQFAP
jgi:hypothetical protein